MEELGEDGLDTALTWKLASDVLSNTLRASDVASRWRTSTIVQRELMELLGIEVDKYDGA